jgi:GR25 family glycosyltransferase involved in LPS biosynthesis
MTESAFNISKYVGGVYYINLDKRVDRLGQIQSELVKMDISGARFCGITHAAGIVGCGYSHLTVLKNARSLGLKNVLILEDDFEFLVSKSDFEKAVSDFFGLGIHYDVLMLSYNIQRAQPFNGIVQRVYEAQTASGYIVNSAFYDRLIDLYERHIPLLEQTGMHWIHANDQIWKQLQGDASAWYAFNTRLGRQRASYSDNSLQFMDYGV